MNDNLKYIDKLNGIQDLILERIFSTTNGAYQLGLSLEFVKIEVTKRELLK